MRLLLITSPLRGGRIIEMNVSRLSVCSLAYLENYTAELHRILLPVAVAQFFSGNVIVRYVLPVRG